jgi:hypothetical protein
VAFSAHIGEKIQSFEKKSCSMSKTLNFTIRRFSRPANSSVMKARAWPRPRALECLQGTVAVG